MTKVTQKNGQEFERFWNSRPEVAKYDAHGAAWSGYQAACQYKEEQVEALENLISSLCAGREAQHLREQKLEDNITELKAMIETQKFMVEAKNNQLDIAKARIAELEEDRKIMMRSHNKLSEVNRELGLESKKCQGLPDARCKYLATCGSPCNKCGRVHNPLSFETYSTGDSDE